MWNKLFRKKSIGDILKQAADGNTDAHGNALSKSLGVRDLTAFGIAAIVGAGIFSTIGNASASSGPAVVFLFIFTAIACGFSAFAYAEFASMVPVSGSAYTYSYVAFGEIMAWIIGWSLIMEYSIGNIAVAISWSDYFTNFLSGMGVNFPEYITMDYLTAQKGFEKVQVLLQDGTAMTLIEKPLLDAYTAFTNAPSLGPVKFIVDIPALFIVTLITALVYKGIHESKRAGNLMVVLKLLVILIVIAVGFFYVNPVNYTPFAPEGISGILKGVSAVFFAYIGFDAISTTAEECKNPQRDLPRGMMYSIIICTILYVAISLVLTGMVNYKELGVGDPLAYVFGRVGLDKIKGIIAFSAVIAMASVLLVFQLGQPRIWLSMSRDGLLPKRFSTIHPKYKTPSFATIITGFLVAVPALFMNLTVVTDLCSIGTLFAFVLVCAGVLKLQDDPQAPKSKFRTPYLNSKFIAPALFIIGISCGFIFNKDGFMDFVKNKKVIPAADYYDVLSFDEVNQLEERLGFADTSLVLMPGKDLKTYLTSLKREDYINTMKGCHIDFNELYKTGWDVFKSNFPYWVFLVVCIYLSVKAFQKNYSLIPLLGLVSCLYMMCELGITNWLFFGIWLVLGLFIYFFYSFSNSRLAKK